VARRLAPPVAALAALALASAVGARTSDSVTTATANGAGGVATVSAGASHPRFLTLSVLASPSQQVNLTWSVNCSNGFRAGSGAGQTAAVAPFTRRFTFAPGTATCRARASAQLRRDGRLTVQIVRGF